MKNHSFLLFSCYLSLTFTSLFSNLPDLNLNDLLESGVTLDLKNPTFCDGVLQTSEGGIICGKDVRIQGQKIVYSTINEEKIIVAEGNLMIEFGDYIFVAEKITYDVKNKKGFIYNGRASADLWFFGGDVIELLEDKSLIIHHGFITTSQDSNPEWKFSSDKMTLLCRRYLKAENIKFSVLNVPFFWIPRYRTDLKNIFESPMKYQFRFGGKQGPRFRMIYEIFSWNRLKTFLRLEYRLNRGPGGGITTQYHSEDRSCYLETLNYVARDSSLIHPSERLRYRFQGYYFNCFNQNRSRIKACWDKLSDKEMAEDYNDETLTIYDAGRTEFQFRHQENAWIANLLTQVQVNSFQTVKQDLPSVEWRFHPITIGSTGVISETLVRAGYLDYDYASDLDNVHDYCSTRFEFKQTLYRPLLKGLINVTPEANFLAIYYGNNPNKNAADVITGFFSINTNTSLHKFYGEKKHVIEPYANYQYYISPTTNPNDHFIFDIDDGWYRLNTLRLGIRNNIFQKEASNCCIRRLAEFEIFTNAFFDNDNISSVFQKVYYQMIFSFIKSARQTVTTAWNIQKNQLDYFNYLLEWTASANFAISTEFRHRGSYDWRKVDYDNFILDSFRSVNDLKNSAVSDRRNTLLLHTFYRFHPYWALEFEVRKGWDRRCEPGYTEYQADLITNLGSAWNLRLSYQRKVDDHRIAFYFNLGARRPNCLPCKPKPCIDF